MTQNSKELIAFAPAAQHYTKQWLPERFVELSDLLKDKYAIMLLGGPADTEICAKIKSDSEAEIIDCSGSTSIIHTFELIRQCLAIVTNDTGVMHIASCTEVPIVAIFGSTVPALGFSPYNAKHSIMENTQLTCRPCTHIGKKNAPKGISNVCQKSARSRFITSYWICYSSLIVTPAPPSTKSPNLNEEMEWW